MVDDRYTAPTFDQFEVKESTQEVSLSQTTVFDFMGREVGNAVYVFDDLIGLADTDVHILPHVRNFVVGINHFITGIHSCTVPCSVIEDSGTTTLVA